MNNRAPMHGPMQRQSSSATHYADYISPEQQLVLRELSRRMLNQPTNQYFFQKTPANYPTSIKRSSNDDYYNYLNQMRSNLRPSSTNYYTLDQDLTAQSSVNKVRNEIPHPKNTNSNDNLNAAASTAHVSFASHSAPQKTNNNKSNLDKSNVQPSNMQNSQLNVQQTDPVYMPIEEKRSNEKISLDHHVIKEQDFDQKQLVDSQLSQVKFESSPELVRLEESLKRSAE